MKTATTSFTETDLKELVDVRRDLHAHPETAFQ
jgi:metal-dependent amidase/aminoacylase/carboxypeptidase family protein